MRVISTVQVGITAIGILTGALGGPLVRDLLGDAIPGWLGFLIGFTAITYVSVVFGELVPKALTLDRAERLVVLVAPPIEFLSRALRPVVWVLETSAGRVLRLFGVRDVVAGASVRTPEDLQALVDEAEGAGVIPRAQEELLHNVFDFARREAEDVMVPEPEVEWIDAAWTVDAALEYIAGRTHSRYPVGEGSLDRLVGVVHVRELAVAARADTHSLVGALAHPAPIVPETKDLGALLRELREARQHLAIVIDEYGGTAGVVTLEDILEELVGEIEDEFDLPDDTLSWIDDHTVDVAGSMTIDDFNEAVGTALPQDDARTLAGLVFNGLGRRPEPDDAVTVGAVTLTVEEVDGNRITRLRVRAPAAAGRAG